MGSDFLMEFVAEVVPGQQEKLMEKLSPVCTKLEVVPHEATRE